MQDVKIKKAKLKDHLFVEAEYSETLPGHQTKDIKVSSNVPAHDDLRAAFTRLIRHLAVLCDEVFEPENQEDFKNAIFEDFSVLGFSIGGNDEYEGVTIIGSKTGKYGNVNLNTPFTKFENEDYMFAGELAEDIEACKFEVCEYLFNEKRAPEKQLEIDFPEGDEPEFEDEAAEAV